jgi:hypothetical protein
MSQTTDLLNLSLEANGIGAGITANDTAISAISVGNATANTTVSASVQYSNSTAYSNVGLFGLVTSAGSLNLGNTTANSVINSTAHYTYANATNYVAINSTTISTGNATVNSSINATALVVGSNVATFGTTLYSVANGNVGIGNTTPTNKLSVQGNTYILGGIVANGSIGSNGQVLTSNGTGMAWATAGGGGSTLIANTTDTQTFYIPMANTTTGTWSNAVVSTTKLYFVPSTGTLNATIFNSLSDKKFKTDIKPVTNALDTLSKIDGVSFKWKESGTKSYGVIAQEIEKILPELVDGKDIKSVNYAGIIAFLINAIKELDQRTR